MRARLFVVLAVRLLVAADERGAKKDQDRIQGTWAIASAQRGGKPADVAAEGHIPKEFAFDGARSRCGPGKTPTRGRSRRTPNGR